MASREGGLIGWAAVSTVAAAKAVLVSLVAACFRWRRKDSVRRRVVIAFQPMLLTVPMLSGRPRRVSAVQRAQLAVAAGICAVLPSLLRIVCDTVSHVSGRLAIKRLQ